MKLWIKYLRSSNNWVLAWLLGGTFHAIPSMVVIVVRSVTMWPSSSCKFPNQYITWSVHIVSWEAYRPKATSIKFYTTTAKLWKDLDGISLFTCFCQRFKNRFDVLKISVDCDDNNILFNKSGTYFCTGVHFWRIFEPTFFGITVICLP